jgi:methylenetetrahydrofolate reductase (NADPH)
LKVGDPVRLLKKQTGLIGMLSKPGGYSPDRLVERLAPYASDEHYDILGLHLYTFDRMEGTEWRRQRMLSPKKATGTGALP